MELIPIEKPNVATRLSCYTFHGSPITEGKRDHPLESNRASAARDWWASRPCLERAVQLTVPHSAVFRFDN
jgi:hypothetical protein